jgi:exonuclease III
MNLKLATWNMDFWQKKTLTAEAWEYLLEKVDADIYLFQESRPLKELTTASNLIWFGICGGNWGTGIYSKNYPIRHLPVQSAHPGSFVVAEAKISDGMTITIISIYGSFEWVGNTKYAMTTLHRTLSDLTGVLNGHIGGKRKIVLGGDLNASLQCDIQDGGKAHQIFFERLADFNLENCYPRFFDKPVQTHRHPGSKIPWQNDYFFISKDLSENLKSCKVLDNEDIQTLSDHNPVLIELEF